MFLTGTCSELSNTKTVDFPFPFEPYSIQKDLMQKIYEVLENSKIGIFESPTGTVRIYE